MKEFVRICKAVGIKKSSKAISFCEKWANETHKTQGTSESMEEQQDNNDADMITYNNSPRALTTTAAPIRQIPLSDEDRKQQWYEKNS